MMDDLNLLLDYIWEQIWIKNEPNYVKKAQLISQMVWVRWLSDKNKLDWKQKVHFYDPGPGVLRDSLSSAPLVSVPILEWKFMDLLK